METWLCFRHWQLRQQCHTNDRATGTRQGVLFFTAVRRVWERNNSDKKKRATPPSLHLAQVRIPLFPPSFHTKEPFGTANKGSQGAGARRRAQHILGVRLSRRWSAAQRSFPTPRRQQKERRRQARQGGRSWDQTAQLKQNKPPDQSQHGFACRPATAATRGAGGRAPEALGRGAGTDVRVPACACCGAAPVLPTA